MQDWLRTLNGQQLRALASQSGLAWRGVPIAKLVRQLEQSAAAEKIWEGA